MTTTTWILLFAASAIVIAVLIGWHRARSRTIRLADLTPESGSETPQADVASTARRASVPLQADHARQRVTAGTERWRGALKKSRLGFMSKVARLFQDNNLAAKGNGASSQAWYLELESILLSADVGQVTTAKLLDSVKNNMGSPEALWGALRQRMLDTVNGATPHSFADPHRGPQVWLVVGVNGVGKTTTIAKLARWHIARGKKVVLGAADTFRAAAVQQLQTWATRTDSELVSGKEGADPASVAFDTVRKATLLPADIAIIDTAGRLHTKAPLMEELKKVHRSAEKALGRPLDEILLVVDATSGQNVLAQAKTFGEALPLSGAVVTKLDGTAKGGMIVAVTDQLQLNVRFVGLGEGLDDLEEFNPEAFVDALFSLSDEERRTEVELL
ncbi:MAG: signal recognition particle-docking protein FtsY [Myxococcales bacterium]|nr:signal recognition particle-docking protein FtsY [Myxococcales bacterium]MCB9708415.1 signal recognition particle-docking protein FtsY [Myxococcales bacterium]